MPLIPFAPGYLQVVQAVLADKSAPAASHTLALKVVTLTAAHAAGKAALAKQPAIAEAVVCVLTLHAPAAQQRVPVHHPRHCFASLRSGSQEHWRTFGLSEVAAAAAAAHGALSASAGSTTTTCTGPAATEASATAARGKPRVLQVGVTGLMPTAAAADKLTRAVLCVQGVQSVTADRAKERLIVYVDAGLNLSAEITNAIAGACASPTDSAACNAPAYLDDGEDVFADARGHTVSHRGMDTVEARLARKRAERANGRTRKRDTVYSAVSSVGSWLWG